MKIEDVRKKMAVKLSARHNKQASSDTARTLKTRRQQLEGARRNIPRLEAQITHLNEELISAKAAIPRLEAAVRDLEETLEAHIAIADEFKAVLATA